VRIAAAVLILLTSSALADEVTLQTPTGTLYGTLLTPSSSGRVPVVLIIAGSGAVDRNGNFDSGENNSLRMLAEALAAQGIASLRYDKRGVAASAAALTADRTIDIEISDVVGWLQQLQRDPRFSLLIVAGHSQGSLIGIVAAQRTAVDRLISLEGAGRQAGDVYLSQLQARLTAPLMDAARQIVASLNAVIPVPNSQVPMALRILFDESLQPYLISWFRYDPAVEIGRLLVPVLIVQGTTDIQISVDDAMLLSDANRSAALRIIDGMNHILKDVPPDFDTQIASYNNPTLPIDKLLVMAVGDFINPPIRRRVVR